MDLKNRPLVFIILVNYNGANDTIACLTSLKNITYENYKILVVDNSSTDDSVLVLSSFDDVEFELICLNENKGFSAGNNSGIVYAKDKEADYFLLLNNDTIVESGFLEPLISQFDKDGQIGVTIGKIFYESNRKKIWYSGGSLSLKTTKTAHHNFNELDNGIENNAQDVGFATGCCLCLSRKVIEFVGLLDEEYFLYEEDVDYCLKVRRANFKISYVPKSVIYHKVSASANKLGGLTQYYMVRNKFLLIKKNLKLKSKPLAYSYSVLMFLNRIRKNELDVKYAIWGILDFLKGLKYMTLRNLG